MKKRKNRDCKACIIKERENNPDATLQQIADNLCFSSRQYVHMVLRDSGKKTCSMKHNTKKNKIKHHTDTYICPKCGANKVMRAKTCWNCYLSSLPSFVQK